MFISKLRIKGFRSFGPTEVIISVSKNLSAFIGLNSSGKTSALEALRKMFGSTHAERELYREDFHLAKDEKLDEFSEKNLSIEVRIDFSEEDEEAVAHFFGHMIVGEENGDPHLRIRLEAKWKKLELSQEGSITSDLFFIQAVEGESEDEVAKQGFSNHLRQLIQILYVPAIRRPAEQLKYASGSILYRVLRKIDWKDDFKEEFQKDIEKITVLFKGLPEVQSIEASIKEFWLKFHKDERYKSTDLTFGGSDLESVLRKLEISFSPTETHRPFNVESLGEGYRSLFYLTLVCALMDVEEKLASKKEELSITKPLLTIVAIEEPENHIAPQLLGRVIKTLNTLSEKNTSQVIVSSHTSAIVKRVPPEAICHFRITELYETNVNHILLPSEQEESYKYIKQAIHNYPEIYFARLVIIGEGDSEEVIFDRLMEVKGIDFDDNIVTFVPLGHRFVNHIWKLLSALNIPYITLLDFDLGREGGGWGRIKYIVNQLLDIEVDEKELLKLKDSNVLTTGDLSKMHTWVTKERKDLEIINSWKDYLEKYDVYYSAPLDLDFMMLQHYPKFYKELIPEGGGPRIPDKEKKNDLYRQKIASSVQATLKSEKAEGPTYSEEEKELMVWYNYHFLGRGKPSTHIQVLSGMTNQDITDNLPEVFLTIFNRISELLKSRKEHETN